MENDQKLPLHLAFPERRSFHGVRAVCPHCGALAVFQTTGTHDVSGVRHRGVGMYISQVMFGRCPGCEGLVVGLLPLASGHGLRTAMDSARLIWPPSLPPDRAPPGLDREFKGIYDQARSVLALSPIAAAVLVRRCLQHVIRTRLGIRGKNLLSEIEKAVEQDDLSKPTREALDHVREIGNWGAHPDVDQANTIVDISPEEASYTLEVLEMLFHDLYVVPERTAAMEAKLKEKTRN